MSLTSVSPASGRRQPLRFGEQLIAARPNESSNEANYLIAAKKYDWRNDPALFPKDLPSARKQERDAWVERQQARREDDHARYGGDEGQPGHAKKRAMTAAERRHATNNTWERLNGAREWHEANKRHLERLERLEQQQPRRHRSDASGGGFVDMALRLVGCLVNRSSVA